jgi:DNA-binding MarR family transcriptional regulator
LSDDAPAAGFDPVIHAPARLQIIAVLAGVQDAEFALLRETVQTSDSVLSKHLSHLAEAGYIRLRKAAKDGRQRTWASLTKEGRRAFVAHVKALQALAGVVEAMSNPPALAEPLIPAKAGTQIV